MPDNEEPEQEPEANAVPGWEDVAPLRRSRWQLALDVLLGKPVVPQSIYLEWLEYRVLFDDLLKRFGAQLARNAKAEHKRIREQLEPTQRPVADPSAGKARVRRLIAESRGLTMHGNLARMPAPPPQPVEDEP